MAIQRSVIVLPQHRIQLGYKPSGTTDCAVRTAEMAIAYGTWGQESPPPAELRPLMGAAPVGGTRISQATRGVRAFGIEPLVMRNGPVARIRGWLEQGLFVAVYGNYGAVIDGWRDLAGSKTYRGGHAIGAWGFAGDETLDFDPLYDGRRPNIPQGPTEVPWALVEAFTTSLMGKGRGRAYAVQLDARLVKSQTDLALANAQIADLSEALELCEAEGS